MDSYTLEAMSLTAMLVLNFFDAALTLTGYNRGLLLEANPLLVPLITTPWLFILAKVGSVVVFSLVLWKLRWHPWTLPASFIAFLVYAGVVVYHFHGLINICSVVP